MVLPFYVVPTREERAQNLYEEALNRFQRDEHDRDDTAIELLREAVLLSPTFEDAYEALGAILNRHYRVDEAIRHMSVLARLNPDSVMAHTNLSVFYVAKGMIPEAEDEKAKAAVLQMKHARQSREAEEIAAAERERIRREEIDRIAMFKEVIEFDTDDPLATFGTGMAYIQLNEYEKRAPHLQRATQVQKDYSSRISISANASSSWTEKTTRAAYTAESNARRARASHAASRNGTAVEIVVTSARYRASTPFAFGAEIGVQARLEKLRVRHRSSREDRKKAPT